MFGSRFFHRKIRRTDDFLGFETNGRLWLPPAMTLGTERLSNNQTF
jgi:hypothetical protein